MVHTLLKRLTPPAAESVPTGQCPQNSPIAQLAERKTVNFDVPGSSPGGGARAIGEAVSQFLDTEKVACSIQASPIQISTMNRFP